MKKYYEEAIQKIKNLNRIVSEEEWNKIAKEKNFYQVQV